MRRVLLLGLIVTPLQAQQLDWATASGNPAATRFSPLSQFSRANVGSLKVLWTFATGSLRAHEGNPLVAGGRLYLHTPHPVSVYAFDLDRPGDAPLWKFAPASRDPALFVCCDGVVRGLAWHPSGKLYVPLYPGDLVAVDAADGKELWRARVGSPAMGITMNAAPVVIGNVVVVGVGGGEFGARGYLSGYNALTGKILWRAYSTGPDADVLLDPPSNPELQTAPNQGVSTWAADGWLRGGGATWGWLSWDPELNLLYHGTGGPAPLNPAQRAGDNKWTASLFARDPATGRAKWALQLTPASGFGYDGSNESILVELSIGGRPVRALVHFDQNGFAYTIDRATGRLLLSGKYGPVNWASSVDETTARPVPDPLFAVTPGRKLTGVCPSLRGLKGFGPAAYSPAQSLFFVPANNLCMDFEPVPAGFTAGKPFLGASVKITPGPGGNRGRFLAWDATRSTIAWEVREAGGLAGGALATAGGLVFYGTLDGYVKALDSETGRELWRFRTPSGVAGTPITFAGPDGKQYLAIVSGAAAADLPAGVNPGGVLLVFGLP
jgi:PQQ-dependent dehydrogenase (methanol/ethanol family)